MLAGWVEIQETSFTGLGKEIRQHKIFCLQPSYFVGRDCFNGLQKDLLAWFLYTEIIFSFFTHKEFQNALQNFTSRKTQLAYLADGNITPHEK